MSFRLTSFVSCFSEYEWERVSKDSCFALLWLTWSRRVVQTDRHGNYLGVAVLLFLNVSARWGGERRGITALPTPPGNLPPCVCMEGQKEETVTCTFKLNLLFVVSLFFFNSSLHPGLVWGITHDAKFQFIIKRIFSTLAVSLYLSSNTGHGQTVVLW